VTDNCYTAAAVGGWSLRTPPPLTLSHIHGRPSGIAFLKTYRVRVTMRVVGIQGSLLYGYTEFFTVNAISISIGSRGRVFVGRFVGKALAPQQLKSLAHNMNLVCSLYSHSI